MEACGDNYTKISEISMKSKGIKFDTRDQLK